MKKLLRVFLFIPGLAVKVFELSKEGSRDLYNIIRFSNAKIGLQCCINEQTVIGDNVRLLNNCLLNNSTIHAYTYIGKNSTIQNATIGKYCSIANDVCIGLGAHPLSFFSTSPLFYRVINPLQIELVSDNIKFDEYKHINIANDVWIGQSAIILDGITIGSGAVIAANSVVTKNVPPYAIVGGVPARIIKYRFSDDKIGKIMKSEWWTLTPNQIKNIMEELNSI
jgi:acetyltransferase-like isoleucine patch superfamily enzyme